jgi:thiamine pyrophosphate-dependent acetolactate synthase large subunit-like protein
MHQKCAMSETCDLSEVAYGLAAAIGAQVAFPNSQVICITGDAGFQMNIQELGTIAHVAWPCHIPVLALSCLLAPPAAPLSYHTRHDRDMSGA